MTAIDLEQILNSDVSILSEEFEDQMIVMEYWVAKGIYGYPMLPSSSGYRELMTADFCLVRLKTKCSIVITTLD